MWKWLKTRNEEVIDGKKEESAAEKKLYICIDFWQKGENRISSFSCEIFDDQENTNRDAYADVCKWFSTQKSPTYTFHHAKGFVIFVRSEITRIEVYEQLK